MVDELLLWGLIGSTLGAIAGSFLATLIVRWPAGRGLGGRSECDNCQALLRWFELLPLLSFMLQQGRCLQCKSRIAVEHPSIEIACALIGAVALMVVPGWEGLSGALLGWILLALIVLDYKYFWLPDRLTLVLALTGLVVGALGYFPPLGARLIGGAAGYATLALVAWSFQKIRGRQGMGAGDPKLFGAIGCWLGWQLLPFVLLGSSILAVPYLLVHRLRKGAITADTRIPLGALMAAAAFLLWICSHSIAF